MALAKTKARLSYGSRSLASLGVFLIATQGFHPKMLLLLEQGETAAWLLALLSSLMAALLVWPVAAALRAMPRGNLADLTKSVVGRPGLILTALLVGAAALFAAGMVLRETSEMTLSAVFPHTPQTFVTVALLMGAIYVAWGDASSLVRLGRLLTPMLLFSLAVVLVGSVGWGEVRYLLPFWGPGVPRLVMGLPDAVGVQFPAVVLGILTADVHDRQGLVRWLPAVPLIGGTILALIQAVLLMVFAYPVGIHIPFPLHTAARLILGGRFFERLEGIWVFVWASSTIVLLGAVLQGVTALYATAFRMPRRQTVILPAATIVLTVAFFSTDQAETIQWHLGVTPALFYLFFLFPAAMALVVLYRQRRRAP